MFKTQPLGLISLKGKSPSRSFALIALMLLSGCAMNCPTPAPPLVQVQTIDTGCDWDAAILTHQGDVLTDATAKAILAHDQVGAKRCGWKPTGTAK
jgi:hypothetical protein